MDYALCMYMYVPVCCGCLCCGSCVFASVTFSLLHAQCESAERLVGRHRLLPSLSDESIDGEEALDEVQEVSLRQRSSEMVKQVGTVVFLFPLCCLL